MEGMGLWVRVRYGGQAEARRPGKSLAEARSLSRSCRHGLRGVWYACIAVAVVLRTEVMMVMAVKKKVLIITVTKLVTQIRA